MSRRRALLIVNKHSRRGVDLLAEAVAGLEANGIEPVYRGYVARDDLTRVICEAAAEVQLVAIGGGDGTMSAAADGLAAAGLPFGLLPMGTANDLARTLGIPSDLAEAARIIAEGEPRRIDLGVVNGHPFFNVASIGISAELARVLTRDIKRRFGQLGYAVAALSVLGRARPFRATIRTAEAEARVSTLQIAVGNGRYYGGGNLVERSASIVDRNLDLYSLELRRAWKLVLMARSFRYGEHGAWQEVRALRAREFDIVTRKPRPVNADGDLVTHTPAHFTIRPAAVSVIVPRDLAERAPL